MIDQKELRDAVKELGSSITMNGGLHCGMPYIDWKCGSSTVCLDGEFSATDLYAIAEHMSK